VTHRSAASVPAEAKLTAWWLLSHWIRSLRIRKTDGMVVPLSHWILSLRIKP